jgi:hypothetical protein
VPETYKQVYPANGKPEDLKEGVIYEAITPPRYRNNGVTAYFTIKNGKAKTITDDELKE